jgi:tRNA G18 (ribose-2'-O)-methylase SpoU
MSATNAIANWVIVTLMKIVLVVHNVRSAHNVGSLLRSADGLGVEKVYLTGYTPYPRQKNDGRLPHLASLRMVVLKLQRLSKQANLRI